MGEEWRRDEYAISTDKSRLDIGVIHGFIANDSYWFPGVARDVIERAIDGSFCFGVYHNGTQVGFARVVTDYATFGYLMDVFVLPAHRGKKLSVWLMETIMAHPRLQGFRVWRLATKDAHTLYEKVGFRPIAQPERLMEILVDPMKAQGS